MHTVFSVFRKLCSTVSLSFLTATMLVLLQSPAMADMVDGTISKLDTDNGTITLDKGKTFILPGEFDYSTLHKGLKVTVFYDSNPSGAYINDIEIQGAKAPDQDDRVDSDESSSSGTTSKPETTDDLD